MDDVHDSGQSSVYHEPDPTSIVAELCSGRLPRLFALVHESDDENDRIVREIRAFGIALPNGGAATVGAEGTGFAHWRSPERAERWTYSELIWLTH